VSKKWNQYVGIVIRGIDDAHGTTLEVLCPELSPSITGTPVPEPEEKSFTVGEYSSRVAVSDTILVDWLDPSKTNRSCPDVVAGEQVWVYQYANMDEYFWLEMGKDVELRSREHIKIFVMNEPNVATEEAPVVPSDENTYYVEMDTRTGSKKIQVSTGCSDGEEFAYTITISPEEKTVTVTDQAFSGREINSEVRPNSMTLYSPTGKFAITNKNECSVVIEEDNITATAVATITTNSADTIINAENGATINATEVTINTSGNTTINSDANTEINAANCAINAEGKCDVTAPNTNITGNVTIKTGLCTAMGAPGPPDGMGGFCSILVCPFGGFTHTTKLITVI